MLKLSLLQIQFVQCFVKKDNKKRIEISTLLSSFMYIFIIDFYLNEKESGEKNLNYVPRFANDKTRTKA